MELDDKSYLTAISRNKLSLPAQYISDNDLLKGDLLDYGCGRGSDANLLLADKYDPYYFPQKPNHQYDTIICNYVLNVVKPQIVNEIVNAIKSYLKVGGTAYIVVRRDIKKEGITSKGTGQWNVLLNLPIVVEKKNKFCIYKLTK